MKTTAERYQLTAREREVLHLLATGVTYAPTIATMLGLRPNTIHNHFKSIFRRTNTRGKAELLALVLEIALEQQARVAPFVRPPRVLVMLHKPDGLCSVLQRVGMQVQESTDAALAASGDFDVVIVDAISADTLVPDTHRRNGGRLVINVSHGPVTAEGRSSGLMSISDDAHRIVLAIMMHVSSEDQRSRLLRVDADLQARLNGGKRTAVANIGTGGAFVRLTQEQFEDVKVGDPIDLDVTLDDLRTLSLRGSVVWQRLQPKEGPTGVGVRFNSPTDDTRSVLEDFVSSRRLAAWMAIPQANHAPTSRSYGLQQSA